MVAVARVQHLWPRDNGLLEDTITNTWYFLSDTASEVDATEGNVLADAVHAFHHSIRSWMSSVLVATPSAQVYDMSDDEPRAPVYEETYAGSSTASDGLPSELAVVVSFQAAVVSGANMRRRRGRVYLGPLSPACFATSESAGDYRVSSSFVNAIDTAYTTLLTTVTAADWAHVVYSPTTHAGSTLFASVFPVVTAWVDNSADIQRRRGSIATVRSFL